MISDREAQMENQKNLLAASSIAILPNLSIRIPSVGEILESEAHYYNLVSSLTATPFQYMVPLDDMGIDFTMITDYQLFYMLFPVLAKGDLRILFGDLDLSDIAACTDPVNGTAILYSAQNDLMIDELVHHRMADALRKINHLQKETRMPGNEEAKAFRIQLERKKQKRNAGKPYEPYLEKLVVALVNRPEFKYNYDEVNHLTIYQFHQSFEQIKLNILFDHTMTGVYAGTVDTSKIKDRSCLSWIPMHS